MKNEPSIKIYRDGRLDRISTYTPVIKDKLVKFGNKLDYFFVNQKWPR